MQNGERIFGTNAWTTIEDQLLPYTQWYFLACYSGAAQIDLDGNDKSEFSQFIETLYNSSDWDRLKALLYDTNQANTQALSDMHYFGHGQPNGIGGRAGSITTTELRANGVMATNPMFYVALDGCKTSETPGLLKAFVGYGNRHTKATIASKGWTPGFGWGWKDSKGVSYSSTGTLLYLHFDFVSDFYYRLTDRNASGFLFRGFQESMLFAQQPGGQGLTGIQNNAQGNSANWVGCTDCRFDEMQNP